MQALAEKYQPLYAALGLHPGMLEKHSDVSLDQLQQALERRPAKVVAVGEIGLDLFGDDPQFERQQWLLDEQLKLAKRYDLPVILHSGVHTTNWRCILNVTIYRALAWFTVFPAACNRPSGLYSWATKSA
ncbi:hypothetical protein CF61_00600 [Escherichia coli]|nr:hypothetical protein CF61_00600 [Escherichia coli]